ncbi:MAG: hypothetical protein AMS22_11445 [Thiotrichales bacterium SG8_50]|nr:MAG: hypothetical protein AMS22_11445 [Thiotrichales bacterium SG8_50]
MSRAFILWLLILLCELVFVMTMSNPELIREEMYSEHESTVSWLGPSTADKINERTANGYAYFFANSGFRKLTYEMLLPREKPVIGDENTIQTKRTVDAFGYVEQKIDGFWLAVYRLVQRANIFWVWFPYFALLFIPAAYDGWQQRAIKKHTYGYASPVRYQASLFVLVGLLFLPVVYFLAPFTITSLFTPIWALALVISTVVMAANVQKSI